MSEGCPREVVYELRCRYAENMRARVAELEARDWDLENDVLQRRVAELEAKLVTAYAALERTQCDCGAKL